MPIDSTILTRIENNDPTLTSLDLSYQNLNAFDIDQLVTALNKNSYLTSLDLTGNALGNEGATLLSHNTTLTSLIIRGAQVSAMGAEALAQHPTLISLDLSQNQVGNAGAIALAQNTILTTLKLAGNQINEEAASAFADNSQLDWLDLSENQFNDVGTISLVHNKKLTTLLMAANQMGDTGAVLLAHHPTLTALFLHHNHITVVGARAFALNPQLTLLDLSYNKLGIEGADTIAKSISLTSLFLIGNDINNVGTVELARNSTLRRLDISYNQIFDEGVNAFSENQSLEELNLNHNQLTAKSAEVLARHPTLRVLSISYNMLGDEGASILAHNDILTELDITGNQVGAAGAVTLAHNTRLKKLVMSYNYIQDAGAIALAYNKTLSELLLSYNHIKDNGAIGLARNQTLKTLVLNYNYIGEKGRAALTQNKFFQLSLSDEQPPDFTHENLNTIFLLTQDLICIRGENDNIQFFNPTFSRILGYKDDELLGQPLYSFLHPDDRTKERKQSPEERMKFPISQHIYRYQHKDGSYRMIQWSSQIKHGRIYASGVDITEKQQADNKLIRTQRKRELSTLGLAHAALYNQQLSDFIAHLCHEIRNPLNGIVGSIEEMQDFIKMLQTLTNEAQNLLPSSTRKKFDDIVTKLHESMTDIEICTEQEEVILDDNLDIAKMVENKLELVEVPFDLKNAVYEVSRMLQKRAKKKGIILNIFLPQEALWIKGDPTRIKQILINLLSNAIKFTHEGHVDLTLGMQEQTAMYTRIELSVTDTSMGLTQQEASKLFSRFTQNNASVGEQYGGSGLGLVIAKTLAHLMGGDITIESEPGKGSTFYCTIQCSNLLEQELQQAKATTKISPVSTKTSQALLILIVDDNALNRKILSSFLEKAGYQCPFAVDGQEAINKYSQQPNINIILMDVIMPKLDGLAATKAIRELEDKKHLSRVPIIGLTGNALEEQRIEALEAGMDDYFTKPYKKEVILKRIAAFFPPIHSSQEASSSKKNILRSPTLWQSFPKEPATSSQAQRVWMEKSHRDTLYPLLDKISEALDSLNIPITMPAPKFHPKISKTGWQLFSIPGKNEHWAVLNFEQEAHADKLVEAIQQIEGQVCAKTMKSGAAYSVVIPFATDKALNATIEQLCLQIPTMFHYALTR